MTHAEKAERYVDDVLSGKRDENRFVVRACERHRRDLKSGKWEYHPELVNRVGEFCELFPHTSGAFATRRDNKIRLEPFQCFLLTAYGWLRRDTGFRRFTRIYLCTARKSGKSTLASALGLYHLMADGEPGAYVVACATNLPQAGEVFYPARSAMEQSPEITETFGVQVGKKQMVRLTDNSRYEMICAKPKDGKNLSAIMGFDEYHQHVDNELWDSLINSMGARNSPMALTVTTAGDNIASPCRVYQEELERMLNGVTEIDNTFALIFTVDSEIDWTSDRAIQQANPNVGVSVSWEFVRSMRDEAMRDISKQNTYKTKQLNLWVNAANSWLNPLELAECQDAPDIEDMEGEAAYMGLDASSKLDMSARVIVFRKEIDHKLHYYVYSRAYLPNTRLDDPKVKNTYAKWVSDGWLQTTEGNSINYPFLAADMVADCERHRVLQFAFDPWNAIQLAQTVVASCSSTQAVEVPIRTQYVSEPMKELEALIKDRRIHFQNDPLLIWCLSNVVSLPDKNLNLFPNKPKNLAMKTDAAIALILALSRAMVTTDTSQCPPGASTDFIC